jgi:ATP-dependent RNA helicase RhlE
VNFNQFHLDSRLSAGIKRAGYVDATPVQEKTIPLALEGYDLIGTAQTGTGKTAAFVLPILNQILTTGKLRQTRALIVTPTRELAEQIHENITILATGTKIRSATVYGGVSASPQLKAINSGVEILVACPGRLLDHIDNNHVKLDRIEMLVLDEADRMLDMGFLPSVNQIIRHVPAQRQTMLFSATFPNEIEDLAKRSLHNPQRIAIDISQPAQTVSQALFPVPKHLKKPLLLELLKETDTESILIFTRTKRRTEQLSYKIRREGYRVTRLHGDMSQNQRQNALNGFKRGTYQIMVATDIAARGLDISSISHVINFDMPNSADDYIHRIGRTGRAESTGDAFTLVTPEDDEMVKILEKIIGHPLPKEILPEFDYTANAASPAPDREKKTRSAPADQNAKANRRKQAVKREPLDPRTKRMQQLGKSRANIKPGTKVAIVLKQDQLTGKLTEGVVKDILTQSDTHPHGIKVRLKNGKVGRVKEILG